MNKHFGLKYYASGTPVDVFQKTYQIFSFFFKVRIKTTKWLTWKIEQRKFYHLVKLTVIYLSWKKCWINTGMKIFWIESRSVCYFFYFSFAIFYENILYILLKTFEQSFFHFLVSTDNFSLIIFVIVLLKKSKIFFLFYYKGLGSIETEDVWWWVCKA